MNIRVDNGVGWVPGPVGDYTESTLVVLSSTKSTKKVFSCEVNLKFINFDRN